MAKKDIVKVSNASADVWDTVRDLVINKADVSFDEISRVTGIPSKTLEAHSLQAGWITKRDLNVIVRTQQHLNRVMLEISEQLNDATSHAEAFIEALQYSHRIKIVKEANGVIRYRNFEDYPDRPDSWDDLTDQQRQALLRYIPPSRLAKFWQDILTVLNFKQNIVNYVSKMSKASLPKMDVTAVTLASKDMGAIDDTTQISTILKDDKEGSGDELKNMINDLNKDLESKKENDDE